MFQKAEADRGLAEDASWCWCWWWPGPPPLQRGERLQVPRQRPGLHHLQRRGEYSTVQYSTVQYSTDTVLQYSTEVRTDNKRVLGIHCLSKHDLTSPQ